MSPPCGYNRRMKSLDVHMLACLDALVTEAHVSRAASRIGIGQPAMSEVLARLRLVFGDPLLVRTRQGMTPTPRALHAAAQAREALRLIEDALSGHERFEPGSTTMDFRIVALSSLAFSMLPRLVRHLEDRAPGVRLMMQPADVRRTHEMLEANECDMVLGYPPSVSAGLHAQPLFRLRLACIARRGHPRIRGKISFEDYLSIPHVVLGAGSSPVSTIEVSVERALKRRRRSRIVGVRTPDLLVSSAVVAGTDLIATVPERIVRELASMLSLQLLKPPLALADPNILMIWHERTHRDPGHRFLRQAIREVAKEFEPVERRPRQPRTGEA